MVGTSKPKPVGQFVWNTTTDTWYWDAGMYELHGYHSGAITPTTDLVLQHKGPLDRPHATDLIEASAIRDQRFSNYHDIVDASGDQRTVLVVGESRADTSRPTLTHRFSSGYMVDLTDDENDRTRLAVVRARESTASIQQSVGLLMGSLGLTEEAAFAVLLRMSNHHSVKVRDLARRFMAASVSSAADAPRDVSQILTGQAAALAMERARLAGR